MQGCYRRKWDRAVQWLLGEQSTRLLGEQKCLQQRRKTHTCSDSKAWHLKSGCCSQSKCQKTSSKRNNLRGHQTSALQQQRQSLGTSHFDPLWTMTMLDAALLNQQSHFGQLHRTCLPNLKDTSTETELLPRHHWLAPSRRNTNLRLRKDLGCIQTVELASRLGRQNLLPVYQKNRWHS